MRYVKCDNTSKLILAKSRLDELTAGAGETVLQVNDATFDAITPRTHCLTADNSSIRARNQTEQDSFDAAKQTKVANLRANDGLVVAIGTAINNQVPAFNVSTFLADVESELDQ
jgi:hypothetical protein